MIDTFESGNTAIPTIHPLALSLAFDLVTQKRMRLVDSSDGRAGVLLGACEFAVATWTGKRAIFVGFYTPSADPLIARQDAEEKCALALQWGRDRMAVQGAEKSDVIFVALGSLTQSSRIPAQEGTCRVEIIEAEMMRGNARIWAGSSLNIVSSRDIRQHMKRISKGYAVPTLAAIDVAERAMLASSTGVQIQRRVQSFVPVMTYAFIGLWIVIDIIEVIILSVHSDLSLYQLGALTSASQLDPWWRYISNAFLHDNTDPLHVLFNSYAMFIIGRLVEQLYGRRVLIGTFLVTAVAGSIAWVLTSMAPTSVASIGLTIGASGGIMGLMGLLSVIGIVHGKSLPPALVSAVRRNVLLWAGLTIVFGLFGSNINDIAHIGGFICGALLGVVLPTNALYGGRDLRWYETSVIIAVTTIGCIALLFAGYNAFEAILAA